MDYDYKGRQAEYKSPDHPLKSAYAERMSESVQVFNYFFHVLTSLSQFSGRHPQARPHRYDLKG